MMLFRSAAFALWFALVTVIIYLGTLPALLLPRIVVVHASRFWSRATFFGLKIIAGVDYEIRGQVPQGAVLIAAKHMSMWDTMGLYLIVWDPAVVLKRELLRIPFYGWYLRKAGIIPIERSAGASAVRQMIAKAKNVLATGRPILIFPEGTRKKARCCARLQARCRRPIFSSWRSLRARRSELRPILDGPARLYEKTGTYRSRVS